MCFNKDELRWDVKEKECWAAIKFVEYFRPYFLDRKFDLVTDHANLKWLMESKFESGKLARWSMRLSCFDFNIIVKSGKTNKIPDALSRYPTDMGSEYMRVSDNLSTPDGDVSLYLTLLAVKHLL